MLDYLIVGFGVSGLAISKALYNKNLQFSIINDDSQKATLAAGGLINPVMLKTGKPVWKVNDFLPFAKSFYHSFSSSFFKTYPIHRVFYSIEDQNNHISQQTRAKNDSYTDYEIINAYNHVNAPYKMSQVYGGGVIQIQNLIANQLKYLKTKHQLLEETFQFEFLQEKSDHIVYKGISAKHIIFTEGFGISNNPYFNDLPVQGNKGEYLIIESKELQLDAILKNKFFLIPLGNDLYKYGATYNRDVLNNSPSEKARVLLKNNLDLLVKCSYKNVDQVAGIRPTVKDKKPIYGTHYKSKNIHLLNGMGSRGLMMAPLLAEELIEHIENDTPLREEVNLNRFTTT